MISLIYAHMLTCEILSTIADYLAVRRHPVLNHRLKKKALNVSFWTTFMKQEWYLILIEFILIDCDSCSSEQKSCSNNHSKTCTCCNFRQCCYHHDPFYPKDQLELHDEVFFRNRNYDSKTYRCQCKIDNFHYPAELRSCLKSK